MTRHRGSALKVTHAEGEAAHGRLQPLCCRSGRFLVLLSPWSTCALVQGGQARPTPFSSLPTALSYLSTDSQLPRQLPGR